MKPSFSIPARERGAALLAVLLLVAVTGAIAAAAMEKLRLSQALAANVIAADRARAFAGGVEQLALVTIEDMIAKSPERTTNAGGWNGAVRRVPMPDGGGMAEGRALDGGNCFNLNSLVQGEAETGLSRRHSGVEQFVGLMTLLEVPESEARRIAEAAADWIDSDTVPGPGGAEDGAYGNGERPYRTGNTLVADPSELRAMAGMTPELYARLRPWLCALPMAELSPINVNTLAPDQAPLLAMIAPRQLRLEQARRILAARPASGWTSQLDFWRTESLSELDMPLDVQLQPQVKTGWFALEVKVETMGSKFVQSALVDARLMPARVVARRWGGS